MKKLEQWHKPGNHRQTLCIYDLEEEGDAFVSFCLQRYQESPIGPQAIGKEHRVASRESAQDKAVRLGYVRSHEDD